MLLDERVDRFYGAREHLRRPHRDSFHGYNESLGVWLPFVSALNEALEKALRENKKLQEELDGIGEQRPSEGSIQIEEQGEGSGGSGVHREL